MSRLRGEEALRAELLKQVLAASLIACFVYIALAFTTRWRSLFFPWDCVEILAAIGLAAWLMRAGKTSIATAFVVAVLSHPLAFLIVTYGFDNPAPALLVPTIVICGLLVGRRLVLGWVAICSAILVFDAIVRRELNRSHASFLLFWCGLYLSVGWLVGLFSKHLERLLATALEVEEAERAATMAERTRMAREMHDTLAQGFTGIVVQMNAAEEAIARDPEKLRGHLERARSLARESLDEARRSIWALREAPPQTAGFLAELEQVAHRILEATSIQLAATRAGQPRPIDENARTQLLRIMQEAVTNTVRHAAAERIELHLEYAPGEITLQIHDNGKGLTESGAGGFGLKGMAERAAQIHGNLEIVARPGAGTTIRVTAPLS